jgi:hypothetical protein
VYKIGKHLKHINRNIKDLVLILDSIYLNNNELIHLKSLSYYTYLYKKIESISPYKIGKNMLEHEFSIELTTTSNSIIFYFTDEYNNLITVTLDKIIVKADDKIIADMDGTMTRYTNWNDLHMKFPKYDYNVISFTGDKTDNYIESSINWTNFKIITIQIKLGTPVPKPIYFNMFIHGYNRIKINKCGIVE